MDNHKNKIIRYFSDWASDLKHRNKGRRKSSSAIRTIDTRVKHLKEIGCPDTALKGLLLFRDQIVRNGRESYNKMSLRKIVLNDRETYKNIIRHKNKSEPMSNLAEVNGPDIEEYARVVDVVSKEQQFCIEHVEQCVRELAEIDEQIESVKSQIGELENKLDNLKQERNYKDYSMRDFAAKYEIKIEEPNT